MLHHFKPVTGAIVSSLLIAGLTSFAASALAQPQQSWMVPDLLAAGKAEGELTISARTPDVGEARETMPVPFAGEPFEIGFNPDFLRDGLDSVGSGDLILKLISPLRPGLIEGADDSGFLYLIMPIRLNV